MTDPSRMELTFANDPTDPRNAADLGPNECEQCQEEGQVRPVEVLKPHRTVTMRLCEQCRPKCRLCQADAPLIDDVCGVCWDGIEGATSK